MKRKASSGEREFSRTFGSYFLRLREAKSIKRRSIVKTFPGLTGRKLRKLERGELDFPAPIMAKMVELYEADREEFVEMLIRAQEKFLASRGLPRTPLHQ